MKKKTILKALKDVTDYAERNHCYHEETYRGGTIWEICHQCGAKWADDEGGMPDDARNAPAPVAYARTILDRHNPR